MLQLKGGYATEVSRGRMLWLHPENGVRRHGETIPFTMHQCVTGNLQKPMDFLRAHRECSESARIDMDLYTMATMHVMY
ncbi:hypothetical protein [Dyella sp. A6]|uniref:hypothetical protein n=1 Tax=Dyella aluminiiresistens TaxID=3069105 RepID=UPI002E7A6421|nr:hypothetical protein [Dyella sp. A6]